MTTDRQAALYRMLLERIDDPVSPSFDELADALGLKSKANVKRMVDGLARQGLVTFVPGKTRTIRAVRKDQFADVADQTLVDELRMRGWEIRAHRKLTDGKWEYREL